VSFLTVEAAAALLLDRQAFRLSSITIVDILIVVVDFGFC